MASPSEPAQPHGPSLDAEVLRDRCRIAAELQNEVIQRIFSIGLHLESTAAIAIDPQVRSRVEQAINDLDHVIRVLRDAVFGLETRLKDRGLPAGIVHLSEQLSPVPDITFGPVDCGHHQCEHHRCEHHLVGVGHPVRGHAADRRLQRVRRQLLHRETKTEASESTLPVPSICVTALRIREKDQAAAKASAGASWVDSGLVFTTRAGTPFEPRNLNRRFETRCAKAGVRRITVHDMRHTCATLLAALDVHPRVAMRILRHAQIDVTMNVYTEVSDAKTLNALKRLGRQLGS